MDTKEYREKIVKSARIAVDELIKVMEEPILDGSETDPEPEKLKNAAATKKLAVMDAFDILARIDKEEDDLKESRGEVVVKDTTKKVEPFAEKMARKGRGNGGNF